MSSDHGVRRRGVWQWLVVVVVVAVVFVAGWWAGRVAFQGPVETGVGEGSGVVLADVVDSEVGASLQLSVSVRQPYAQVAVNQLAGVVTGARDAGGQAQVGEVLYSVAEVPVRVVEGDVPFYRDLSRGDSGEDVRQLQQALVVLGYLSGGVDGKFGTATYDAVRAWQEDLGQDRSGSVRLGELIAVPGLPQSVSLGEDIVVGRMLAGGEPALSARTGEVVFELVLSADQASLVPAGAALTIPTEDGVWEAVVGERGQDENGNTVYTLTAPDLGPVCGQDCDSLPAQEESSILSQVHVVPTTSGPTVPVAAIRTGTDGAQYVLLSDGQEADVQVLASSGGVAVVDGVQVGDRVQIGADGSPPPAPDSSPGEQTDPTGGEPSTGGEDVTGADDSGGQETSGGADRSGASGQG